MFPTSNNLSEPSTTEEEGGGQQGLFAEWDEIAQSELANPTNKIENNATSDYVADWNGIMIYFPTTIRIKHC